MGVRVEGVGVGVPPSHSPLSEARSAINSAGTWLILRAWGLGFGVEGLEFGFWGLGFGV